MIVKRKLLFATRQIYFSSIASSSLTHIVSFYCVRDSKMLYLLEHRQQYNSKVKYEKKVQALAFARETSHSLLLKAIYIEMHQAIILMIFVALTIAIVIPIEIVSKLTQFTFFSRSFIECTCCSLSETYMPWRRRYMARLPPYNNNKIWNIYRQTRTELLKMMAQRLSSILKHSPNIYLQRMHYTKYLH